jgi:hypothetical protein
MITCSCSLRGGDNGIAYINHVYLLFHVSSRINLRPLGGDFTLCQSRWLAVLLLAGRLSFLCRGRFAVCGNRLLVTCVCSCRKSLWGAWPLLKLPERTSRITSRSAISLGTYVYLSLVALSVSSTFLNPRFLERTTLVRIWPHSLGE